MIFLVHLSLTIAACFQIEQYGGRSKADGLGLEDWVNKINKRVWSIFNGK
jgi:hypothetical protein